MRLSSVIAASSTPNNVHHHVAVIAGVCLGAAAAVLLLGLVFFWVLLRHRQHMAMAQVVHQDVVPRSWVSSDYPTGGQDVAVVANHPSLSVDLTGADIVVPASSDETAEEVLVKRRHHSTDVLDIRLENVPRSRSRSRSRSPLPLPEPIEPYVPSSTTPAPAPAPPPTLCIRTDVHAESPSSLPDSHSHENTPAGSSSRSPIRPLPTPPTVPRMRRPRSAKTEEARRESRRSNMPRFRASADDLRAYVHGNQRSTDTANSIVRMSYETDGYEIVQHHDGRIDLPPPYHECMPVEATPPST